MPTKITDPTRLAEIAARNERLGFGTTKRVDDTVTYTSTKKPKDNTFSFTQKVDTTNSDTTGSDTPEAPLSETYKGFLPTDNADYEAAQKAYRDSLNYTPLSEEEIRAKVRERMQQEIDATNKVYAEKLRQEAIAGRGRLGQSRAIQAASGQLGSTFGQAQKNVVSMENQALEEAINNQRLAEEIRILTEGRTDTVAEAEKQYLAKQTSAKNILDYYAGQVTEKANRLKSTVYNMINSGETIDEATFTEISKALGVSPLEVKALYNATKVSEEDSTKVLNQGDVWVDEQGNVIYSNPKSEPTVKPETQVINGSLYERGADGVWKQVITGQTDSNWEIRKVNGIDYEYNPTTGQYREINIPTSITGTATQAQLDTVFSALNGAKQYSNFSGRSPITEYVASRFGATGLDNLKAYANTLRTNILTLQTDPNIKKFFGPQMSNADVQLMMSGGTILNPELQSADEFNKELTRIENALTILKNQVGQSSTGQQNTTNEEAKNALQTLINQGVPPAEAREFVLEKYGSFNTPQSTGKKGSTDVTGIKDGTRVSTLMGDGVATSIVAGSKFWKYGLDLALAGGKGAPVPVPFGGEVVFAGKDGGFGNSVKVKLDNGEIIRLSHLNDIKVKKGDKLSSGAIVGGQGNTGKTYGKTGIHVDVTMYKPNGKPYTSQEVASFLNTQIA